MDCKLNYSLTLTRNIANTYPRPLDIIHPKLMKTWSRHINCLPQTDFLNSLKFKTCAIVGGANKLKKNKKKYDAIFRVGKFSEIRNLNGRIINIRWLSDPILINAMYNIYVMGSVHENIKYACRPNSFITNPILKENDMFFKNLSKSKKKAKSLRTMKNIYNPSLGFFAIRIGLHMCSSIHLYSYDLHILNPNALYRKGWGLVKDHHHDFILERKTIPKLMEKCGHKNYNLYLNHYKI